MEPSRRTAITLTVVHVLLLPVAVFAAFGAMVATVMGLGATGQLELAGAMLTLFGIVVMLTPVVVVGAVAALWIGQRRSQPRLWRWAVLTPIPFLAATAVVVAMMAAG